MDKKFSIKLLNKVYKFQLKFCNEKIKREDFLDHYCNNLSIQQKLRIMILNCECWLINVKKVLVAI